MQHGKVQLDELASAMEIENCVTFPIPLQSVAPENNIDCKVEFVLHNQGGKTWQVVSVQYEDRFRFTREWRDFVRDNNINTGDISVFVLVGEYEFPVYTLRFGRRYKVVEYQDHGREVRIPIQF